MNGTLPIQVHRFKWQYFTVAGGPYGMRPKDMFGVKMAVEIQGVCDVSIPTRDYSTPNPALLNRGLVQVIDAMKEGRMVYIGCMAGRGRTGLFMAILAKAFGVKQPVEYVRQLYFSHAVETNDQYRFVMDYEFPKEVKNAVRRAKRAAWMKFYKTNLTERPKSLVAFEERSRATMPANSRVSY